MPSGSLGGVAPVVVGGAVLVCDCVGDLVEGFEDGEVAAGEDLGGGWVVPELLDV